MLVPIRLIQKLVERPAFPPLVRAATAAYLQIKPCIFHIDEPQDHVITNVVGTLIGWFALRQKSVTPVLRINNADLTWMKVQRPDIAQLFGQEHSHGFRALIDLNQLVSSAGHFNDPLTLELVIDGQTAATQQLEVEAHVVDDPRLAAERRARKQEWLKRHVVCPVCVRDIGELSFTDSTISCRKCGETFSRDGSVLDFLPHDVKQEFRIEDWSEISAHGYDDVASGIIEDVRRKGGKVLDCGSGLRSRIDETVICLDVAALPTVDILAVNQRLPFRDAIFDAVLSLNVLEHVTDPFASAAELVRVLKPGGTLYCCIPFLQPEHGFPHHYFNATRSGLRQLFPKNLELVNHFVPASGEPVWSLQWFLSWYAEQLPVQERNKFLELRVRDIVDTPMPVLQRESWVSKLSVKGRWGLASTTAAVFRKPGGS